MSVLDNALQTLFKLGIEVKKAWENASPTSGFAAQSINIGTSNYDFAMILHQSANVTGGNRHAIDIIENNTETNNMLRLAGFVASSTAANRGFGAQRGVMRSGNTLQFTDCVRGRHTGEAIDSMVDPSLCKPVIIYTIKIIGGGYRIARFIKSLFHIRERGWA